VKDLQCVSIAKFLGGLVGLAAIFGVAGSVLYPQMRKHVGLEKTGLLGFFWILVCLLACVVSLWLPGSPFAAAVKTSDGLDDVVNKTLTNSSKSIFIYLNLSCLFLRDLPIYWIVLHNLNLALKNINLL